VEGTLRKYKSFFQAAVFVMFACALCVAQTGKVESLGALTDSSVADSVRSGLENKGYRITLEDGSVACELWFMKGIAGQSKEVAGAVYSELAESTLVGVLHFSQPGSDYRGQPIASGYYTLRYELLPNDGNHLGAAANRDFLLLVPAATDKDPATNPKPAEVIELSRKASGTHHPAPLSLVQPDNSPSPSVTKAEEDHWIFTGTTKLASGREMPIALVVKGQAQQ
jgi:hypothetical protein